MQAENTQADFIGGVVVAMGAICVLVAAFSVVVALTTPGEAPMQLDQTGSANPQALPTPQAGSSSSQVNPKADQAPPPSQMPDASQESPAARGENPANVPPPATDTNGQAEGAGQ